MSKNISSEISTILVSILQPTDSDFVFSPDTLLLGSMPEFDSMSVLAVLTALEEYYGFCIEDDEIDGSIFTTVDTLTDFVKRKLAA